jgi:hypothetical protein
MNERNETMNRQTKKAATAAVRAAVADGVTCVEQVAIRRLHEAGFYSGLTCDEARDLDAAVREACETI